MCPFDRFSYSFIDVPTRFPAEGLFNFRAIQLEKIRFMWTADKVVFPTCIRTPDAAEQIREFTGRYAVIWYAIFPSMEYLSMRS